MNILYASNSFILIYGYSFFSFRCILLKMVGRLILAIIRGGRVLSNIGPEDEIREGDTIVVIGKRESRDKLEELEFS